MKNLCLLLLISVWLISCNHFKETKKVFAGHTEKIDWAYADSIKGAVQLSQIPPDTFYISDLPTTDTTQTVQAAINRVAESGGGTLILPEGIYYSGALTLRSKVELLLDEGAVLKFIPDPACYPLVYTWFSGIPCMNFSSMIYARNQSDIKISGSGIIDGQGTSDLWKNMKYSERADWDILRLMNRKNIDIENRRFGEGHSLRPDLMAFYECSNIQISGIEIINTPYFALHPVMSNHVSIENCTVQSTGYHQIGFAIESCRNMTVKNNVLNDLGEGIKILSGGTELEGNQACSNIVIENNQFNNIAYTPIIFSSKSIKGLHNIFINGATIHKAETGISFYGKEGVKIDNVLIKNIFARDIGNAFLFVGITGIKTEGSTLGNIQLDSVRVNGGGRAFMLIGHELSAVENITVSHSEFNVSKGSFAKHIRQFKLEDTQINGSLRNLTCNLKDMELPEVQLNYTEEEILESDDIQFSKLPVSVRETLEKNYPFVPIRDIDRIITSSNAVFQIKLELESFERIGVFIQSNGKILRRDIDCSYSNLPNALKQSLSDYLKTEPEPFIFNEIKQINYTDYTYYEIKGEYQTNLFALGITGDGKIIEEKQQNITSYFLKN